MGAENGQTPAGQPAGVRHVYASPGALRLEGPDGHGILSCDGPGEYFDLIDAGPREPSGRIWPQAILSAAERIMTAWGLSRVSDWEIVVDTGWRHIGPELAYRCEVN